MMPASSRWSEFREGGGLWVLAQFALMAGILAAWLLPPEWPDSVRLPLRVVGIVLIVTGIVLVAWARGALGRAFTPFTRPSREAALADTGPYRLARHPMYGGALVLFAGLALQFGVAALVLTGALGILWRAKSRVEEGFLVARFPEYEAYRARTPHRFWPWIY
jgi:protein-S-isoprenylcysteine O-methyltransferase Ste14